MSLADFELRDIAEPHKVDTPWSHPLPPAGRHSVTSHIPGWKALVKLSERDPAHLSKIVSIYPRILLHRDCAQLVRVVTKLCGLSPEEHTCFLFPRLQVAQACVDYVTSPNRTDGKETLAASAVSIRAFETSTADAERLLLFAVVFPAARLADVMSWWSDTGVGISSRLAEDVLGDLGRLREVPLSAAAAPGPTRSTHACPDASHRVLRERIAALVERAPATTREKKVRPEDVFLFQSGMAAIYNAHRHLQHLAASSECKSVILGVSFYETRHVLMKYGTGLRFFPSAADADADALEGFLRAERAEGRPVVSVWTEYPSNPLLSTPDLARLRRLADELGFALVVDDTVGGFCNVDALAVADVAVTSLSKTFSGYADVLGGSVVLNPSGRLYDGLRRRLGLEHGAGGGAGGDLYAADARALRHNSEDYLHRSAITNSNARMLADWLCARSRDGRGSVESVFYPTTTPHAWARANYQALMRRPTAGFTPGYGCLLSVGFRSQASAVAFYDNLHVYHGPHLGAHRTLALGYTYLIYGAEDELGMAGLGLSTAQIRISVGLEDADSLLHIFKYAVMKADQAGGPR